MTTAVACVPDGVVGGVPVIDTVLPPTRFYPVREVNRHMGLPTLAGCGHAFAPNDDGENGSTPCSGSTVSIGRSLLRAISRLCAIFVRGVSRRRLVSVGSGISTSG